jgi:inorganic pyrophosphatase
VNLYYLPIGQGAPETVNFVVEIPKGTRNKVEYLSRFEIFQVDRILHSPVHYPGDYGFIPSTLSPDGDALDALVLVTDPSFTGCLQTVRPVGVLEMTDEEKRDEKILAVPDKDPRFQEIRDIGDLPSHILKEIEYFFNIYKELEGKKPAILGWHPIKKAHAIIREAEQAFSIKG